MPPPPLTEPADQLLHLAVEFETLHARVRDVSYTPGSDGLRQVTPLLLISHDLTATALVRLRALDNSPGTTIIGSRSGRELMVSVAFFAARASADLAHALLANPAEDAPNPVKPADEPSVRNAVLAEAIATMTGHLADALHHLDLSATGCHTVAAAVRDATATAQPAPS
ncbi:hypothetical protein AB0D07_01255 [Streptomyces globisporus]|uniref:hypothetical protein n=1 Tax=Streptomyces globisporus TaxID=1908 RepID=UPI00345F5202